MQQHAADTRSIRCLIMQQSGGESDTSSQYLANSAGDPVLMNA